MVSRGARDLTAEFARLERVWADAVIAQDRATLEHMLAPEYCLVVSAAPDRPVPRASWLDQAVGPYRVRRAATHALAARQVGEGVVAVSLLLEMEASVGDIDRSMTLFIVDVWRRDADGWRVVVRPSSLPEAGAQSNRAVTGS